jgi:hypothetical protein
LDLFEIEENNKKWAKGFKNLNHEGLKLNEKLNEFEKRKLNLKIKPLVVAAIGWRWRLNQVFCVCCVSLYIFLAFVFATFLLCFSYFVCLDTREDSFDHKFFPIFFFNLLAAENLNKCSVKNILTYWLPKAFNKFFRIIF